MSQIKVGSNVKLLPRKGQAERLTGKTGVVSGIVFDQTYGEIVLIEIYGVPYKDSGAWSYKEHLELIPDNIPEILQ